MVLALVLVQAGRVVVLGRVLAEDLEEARVEEPVGALEVQAQVQVLGRELVREEALVQVQEVGPELD